MKYFINLHLLPVVLASCLRNQKNASLLTFLIVLGLACGCPTAFGQYSAAYQSLKSFGNSELSGGRPDNKLVIGSDNRLYGFTRAGGDSNGAVIFRINVDGTDYRVLRNYRVGGPNSSGIIGALLESTNGMLYGITGAFGTNDAGTLFSMNKDGTSYTIARHYSTAVGQAGYPYELLEGSDGALYGLARSGTSLFTLYKVNRDGSALTILHMFNSLGTSDYQPYSLIESSDGALYGCTASGLSGGVDAGTVFKINKNGTGYTIILGRAGYFLTEGRGGKLYLGVPYFDVNSYCRMNRDGTGLTTNTLLYGAQKLRDNNMFEGQDGEIYLTGFIQTADSTFIQTVMKDGGNGAQAQLLHEFGGSPYDGGGGTNLYYHGSIRFVQAPDGTLYGTTLTGGNSGIGTIFKLSTNGTDYSVLWNFSRTGGDGIRPFAALMQASDGALYGSTTAGGAYSNGTIFRLMLDGSLTTVHQFVGYDLDGVYPTKKLIEATDGLLYGTSYGSVAIGGTNFYNVGTIFRINKNGSNYAVLLNLSGNSHTPVELVEGNDGVLYGINEGGSTGGYGAIFRVNKDGSGYTELRYFTSAIGSSARGIMEGSNGSLYVTCNYGGTLGYGTVIRLSKDGTGLAVLHYFGNSAGEASQPSGSLCKASDGFLYGVTLNGGANNKGAIFRIAESGTGYQVVRSLGVSATDSAGPAGHLVEALDGFLYGTTTFGGTNNRGTIFRVRKDGSGFQILRRLPEESSGSYPDGVCVASNGLVYGTTALGGQLGFGTIFSLSPPAIVDVQVLPSTTNVATGATVAFTPIDGTPPYTFTLIANNSGGSITSNGVYTAGLICATDNVRVTDASNSTATATITTLDTTPPNIVCPANILINTNLASVAVPFTATATDNCTASPAIICAPASGSLFAQGMTAVNCRATDGAGNSNSCSFLVTVFNLAISPVATNVATGGIVAFAATGGSPPYLYSLVTNNTGGSLTVNGVYRAGSASCAADTVRITDGSNHTATATVRTDTTAPSITCPANIVVVTNRFTLPVTFTATATDDCTASPLIVCTPASGSTFRRGTTNVICRATDSAGNSNSCSFLVTVTTFLALAISPTNQNIASGGTVAFTAVGGTPPYVFSIATNNSGATLTNGAYTAGPLAGTDAVRVTDAAGSNALALVTVTVTANSAPSVSNAIPAQAGAYGAAFQFTFASDVFTDPDAGQSLTYAATNQPPGVGFDAVTRTFSGTNGASGMFAVSVIATDNGVPPRSATNNFGLTVTKAPLTLTANNTNRPYGEANPAFTGVLTGLLLQDNITATFGSAATPASPPGTYPIAPALADPDSRLGNYTITTNLGTLTIQEVRIESSLAGTTATLSWPTGAVNLLLECTASLEPPVTWQTVTSGITITATNISYTVLPVTVPPSCFYRLRLP